MKNQTQSAKSPKNTFVAEIDYSKPLSQIGSASRTGAMTLEDVKHGATFYTDQAKRNGAKAMVTIKENKKVYPDFEWVVVERYEA